MLTWDEVIRQRRTSSQITTEAMRAYRYAFDEWVADLKRRLQLRDSGVSFAGLSDRLGQRRVAAEIYGSIRDLQARLHGLAPEIADYISERITQEVGQTNLAWLRREIAKAPVDFRPQIPEFGQAYLERGSLLRERILNQLDAGFYQAKYGPMLPTGGYGAPIHHRLIQRTEQTLRDAMSKGSGNFGEMVLHVERNVFGVDAYVLAKEGKTPHPAIATDPLTGKPVDLSYGTKAGFSSAGNPNGARADVERLVRTEQQSDFNTGRVDEARGFWKSGDSVGVHIEQEPGDYGASCPICGPAIGDTSNPPGSGNFYFDEGEPPTPPDDTHPNCVCSVTGILWIDERK